MTALHALVVLLLAAADGHVAQTAPPPPPELHCEEDGAKLHARLKGPAFGEHRFKFLTLPDNDFVLEGWEGDNTWSITLRHTSGRVCLIRAGRWQSPRRDL